MSHAAAGASECILSRFLLTGMAERLLVLSFITARWISTRRLSRIFPRVVLSPTKFIFYRDNPLRDGREAVAGAWIDNSVDNRGKKFSRHSSLVLSLSLSLRPTKSRRQGTQHYWQPASRWVEIQPRNWKHRVAFGHVKFTKRDVTCVSHCKMKPTRGSSHSYIWNAFGVFGVNERTLIFVMNWCIL